MALELWHEWNSVHSFKVRVVLEEKRLSWVDRRVELLKLEQLLPEYLRVNPSGTVPALVHDGRAVVESSVICEYLDEAFPQPAMMPADPHARAQARRWLKYHDDIAHAPMRKASFQLLYKPYLKRIPKEELDRRLRGHPNPERAKNFRNGAEGEIDFAVLAEAIGQFAAIAARIDAALEDRVWLTGERFGLADAAMAPFAERMDNLGMRFVWSALPRAKAWAERLLARDSVKRSMAPAPFRLPAPAGEVRERVLQLGAALAGARSA